MHIPDGFLTLPVYSSFWALALGFLGVSLRKTREFLGERFIPLMAVSASFIFAAQMLNFPVLGGTSGHLIGGVLAAVLLGPYAGIIVLALVLIIQCLVFQDGGITALGANIFNMAVIGAGGGYLIYAFIRRRIAENKGILFGVFIGSWLSVIAASISCSLQLGLSGTSPFKAVFASMLFVHIFIGLGEAFITTFVIGFILKVRPDLIYNFKKIEA